VLDFGWALQSSFQLRSHAGQLRQNWGQRWQPPQQIQRLSDDQISALAITERYVVREDLATWRGQMLDTGYRPGHDTSQLVQFGIGGGCQELSRARHPVCKRSSRLMSMIARKSFVR